MNNNNDLYLHYNENLQYFCTATKAPKMRSTMCNVVELNAAQYLDRLVAHENVSGWCPCVIEKPDSQST